jgi:hypothetical protein
MRDEEEIKENIDERLTTNPNEPATIGGPPISVLTKIKNSEKMVVRHPGKLDSADKKP